MNLESNKNSDYEVEMQELTQCVLQSCKSIDKLTRQTFISVVKTFYYVAHRSPKVIDNHISKVIFEDVI
jgi:transcriptional regulator NrdR family protein